MLKQKTPLKAKTKLKAKKGLNRGTSTLKSNSSLKAKTPLKTSKNGLKSNPEHRLKANPDNQLKRTEFKPKIKKTPERTSIVFPDLTVCCLCGKKQDLEKGIIINKHEIFFGSANRDNSIADKMIAPLCPSCHNMGNVCVHNNRELDLKLKRIGQEVWEKTYGTREDFINRYKKSWL